MRIAIDSLPLLAHAGGKSYLSSLLKHLFKIDKSNDYFLFFRTLKSFSFKKQFNYPENVSFHRIAIPNRLLEFLWTKNDFYIPYTESFFLNPDVYFATMYFSPVFAKCSIVAVVYDLTVLKYEGYKENAKIFDMRLKNMIKRAKYIISISEYTKKDLCEHYQVNPDKVFVTPLAADERFKVIEDKEKIIKVKSKYKITNEYILYVGNLGPHKNLVRLIKVFEKLKKVYRISHKLLLCGKKYWGGEVVDKIKSLFLEDEVLLLDYVPDEDLPYLYNGADVFVYISLYEGFGLPVLEAMNCGTAVVASNTTSLPEVVRDGGVLVNPIDEEEILGAILKVLSDKAFRNKLSEKALSVSRNFNWDKTAKLTLDVFKRAVL
ncbi:MAG: glycosyltransferase family 4 protein [Elusimicrobiota bacterium]